MESSHLGWGSHPLPTKFPANLPANITSKLSCPVLSPYTLPLSPHSLLYLAEFKKSPQGN
jgi:hypothetical protein